MVIEPARLPADLVVFEEVSLIGGQTGTEAIHAARAKTLRVCGVNQPVRIELVGERDLRRIAGARSVQVETCARRAHERRTTRRATDLSETTALHAERVIEPIAAKSRERVVILEMPQAGKQRQVRRDVEGRLTEGGVIAID